MYKAVLWDFGGVITTSPFEAFSRFEKDNNLPTDFIRGINSTNPDTNAWAQLESNDITTEEFDAKFAEEAKAQGHNVGGQQVLALLSGDVRPEMVEALRRIKTQYQVGCITNNVKNAGKGPGMASSSKKAESVAEIMGMFDFIIESSKAGIRKPNPKIYQMACDEINIEPKDAIFLDDLGINLKPAKALGMSTIKVLTADQAIGELEALLKMELR